jgi:pilus assembly protein FimV
VVQPASPLPRPRGATTDNDLDFDLSPAAALTRPAPSGETKPAVAPAEPARTDTATATGGSPAAADPSNVREPAKSQASPVSSATALGAAFTGSRPELRPSQLAAEGDVSQPQSPDFSLDPAAPVARPQAESKPSQVLDFDLDSLPPTRTIDATGAERVSSEPPPRDFEFKLDLDKLELAEPGDAKAAATPRDAHWYDVQQKFDLAKAYEEMGDKDGARDILREVLKEGDQDQRVQATQLLAKLS